MDGWIFNPEGLYDDDWFAAVSVFYTAYPEQAALAADNFHRHLAHHCGEDWTRCEAAVHLWNLLGDDAVVIG